MNIVSASLINFSSNLVKIIGSLIVIKVIAAQTGPAGIAMMGQMGSAINLLLPYTNAGIGNGIVKYIAEYNSAGRSDQTNEVVNTSMCLTLLGSTVIAIAAFFLKDSLSYHLFGDSQYAGVITCFAFALPLMGLGYSVLFILNGYKRLKAYSVVTALNSIAFVGIAYGLTVGYGITGSLISMIVSQSLLCFIGLVSLLTSNQPVFSRLCLRVDRVIFNNLLKFAYMGLVSASLGPLSQIFIRTYIINCLSIEEAGYWQAVCKISETYLSLIIIPLSVYYLPRLSEIQHYQDLKSEIQKTFIFSVSAAAVAAALVYAFRHFIITAFLSRQFTPIEVLFPFQLLGDLLKVASWAIGMVMWAKSMTRLFIMTEVFFTGSFVLFTIIAISEFGLVGATYAYAFNYGAYFIFLAIYFQKNLARVACRPQVGKEGPSK
jgi:PST family polysaccharide transporter